MVVSKMRLLLTVMLVFIFAAAPVFAEEMTKEQLQKMYVDYLKSEGFSPSLDDDGDVMFKYEGGTYFIIVDEKDQEFFAVLYPNFWEIESENEREQALLAAKEATRSAKVAKVYLIEDNTDVSLSAEVFLKTPSDFKGIFHRMMSSMTAARKVFVDKMQ